MLSRLSRIPPAPPPLVFTEWVALILAIQILGGELSGGGWLTGLTREARRGAHFLAKTVAACGGLLFIQGVSTMVNLATQSALGASLWTWGDLSGRVGKSLVVGLVWIMLGFVVSALSRSVVVSYAAAFIFLNADAVTAQWDLYQPISVNADTSLFYGFKVYSFEGGITPDNQEGGALLALLSWAALMAFVSWALLRFRDA